MKIANELPEKDSMFENKKNKSNDVKIRKGVGIMGTRAHQDEKKAADKKKARKKINPKDYE